VDVDLPATTAEVELSKAQKRALITFVIFSLSSSVFLHRRQQPLQQQMRSQNEVVSLAFIMSMLSTFLRLNGLLIFLNGQQQQLLHFWPAVCGCIADFPAIIWALSERGLRTQHDESPQQILRFRFISFMLELLKEKY